MFLYQLFKPTNNPWKTKTNPLYDPVNCADQQGARRETWSAETPQSETLHAAGVKYSFKLHEDILYSKQFSDFFIQNACGFYKTVVDCLLKQYNEILWTLT